jgi:hypothetical protein
MDIDTVQTIIDMIDNTLNNTKSTNPFGYSKLIDLRIHLQNYIEAELDKAENKTVE